MPIVTEGAHPGEFILREFDTELSREPSIITGGNYAAGTVMAELDRDTVAGAADAGNTGDGTLTGIALGALAQIGNYLLTCIEAAVDGGVFQVQTPAGELLPPATVGVAYAGDQLNFTLNDGAADFVVGDRFTIAVSGSGKWTQLDPAGVDGSQRAAGILYDNVDASVADADGVLVVREAAVMDGHLTWPAGISAADKAAATAALAEADLIVR